MNRKVDYYETLGVAESASSEEIAAAFRSLAKIHHPDHLPPEATQEQRARANASMARIVKAYGALRDPAKRARYDQLRRIYPRAEEYCPIPAPAPREPLEHVLRKVVAVSAMRSEEQRFRWEDHLSWADLARHGGRILTFLTLAGLLVLWFLLDSSGLDWVKNRQDALGPAPADKWRH